VCGRQHMLDYTLDVCLRLAKHGFKKILIVNGHGSNVPVLDLVARQTIVQTGDATACASLDFWSTENYERTAATLFPECDGTGHADAIETSLYISLRPELVRLELAHDDPSTGVMELGTGRLPFRLIWSSFSKEEILGTVSGADRSKGQQLIAAAVGGLAKIFVRFSEKEIPLPVNHH
jgi:creatinine amidohydrolase